MKNKLTLFRLYSNGCILQRLEAIKLRGTAEPFSEVVCEIDGLFAGTVAGIDGRWRANLGEHKAGGPYTLTVSSGGERIIARDIYFGDVYIISGQSNMELPLSRTVPLLNDELKKIVNPLIREFRVPICYDFEMLHEDYDDGCWLGAYTDCGVNTSMSAAGYFFSASIYEKYGVPIGLINTAVGGSPVETRLRTYCALSCDGFDGIIEKCRTEGYVAAVREKDEKDNNEWYNRLNKSDKGFKSGKEWYLEELDDGGWESCDVPFYLGDRSFCGSIWFRKTVYIPVGAELSGEILLRLGALIDGDETYVNGVLVGDTGYKYPPRRYLLPRGLLRHGENTLVVRLIVNRGCGGFVGGKKYALEYETHSVVNKTLCDLSGRWKMRIGAEMPYLPQTVFFQYMPCGLFNAMDYPLRDVSARAVLWYQGESNDNAPHSYYRLFTALIRQWRTLGGKSLPFVYVQLPGFTDPCGGIEKDAWAVIREAQRQALTEKNTAMVVSIDAGESNDLHPLDKKIIGERLALCVRTMVYGESVSSTAPSCTTARRNADGTVTLEFDGAVRLAEDRYFELYDGAVSCGVSARGTDAYAITLTVGKGDTVRYAYMNDPVNPPLFGLNGLPVSPFVIEITD